MLNDWKERPANSFGVSERVSVRSLAQACSQRMASAIPPDIDQNNSKDIRLQRIEDPRKYSVFDPRRVPCLRASLLTGIGGGLTFALVRKLITSMTLSSIFFLNGYIHVPSPPTT